MIGARLVGPAARNATSCMIQAPAGETGAVALYVPVADTTRSSRISPFGTDSTRIVYPVPGPVVIISTQLAATKRSVALWVKSGPLSLRLLLPDAPTAPATGLRGSRPQIVRE